MNVNDLTDIVAAKKATFFMSCSNFS